MNGGLLMLVFRQKLKIYRLLVRGFLNQYFQNLKYLNFFQKGFGQIPMITQ